MNVIKDINLNNFRKIIEELKKENKYEIKVSNFKIDIKVDNKYIPLIIYDENKNNLYIEGGYYTNSINDFEYEDLENVVKKFCKIISLEFGILEVSENEYVRRMKIIEELKDEVITIINKYQ